MYTSIYIQTTLDAEGIMKNYPTPSLDENKPTNISHKFAYMVATSNSISGNGSGELLISANVGDTIRFNGSSASNNFDDSIMFYGIFRFGGDSVFSEFNPINLTAIGVTPSEPNTLPEKQVNGKEFNYLEAAVIDLGSEWYGLSFALYNRDSKGLPSLFGYFQWVSMLTASN